MPDELEQPEEAAGVIADARWRSRRRTFAIVAAVFAAGALVAWLLAPRGGASVPSLGSASGDVELRFAFAFPEPGEPPLERPVGVAVAGERVYVTDSSGSVVHVFDDRGIERGLIGEDSLAVPVYAAADAARGVLYVTDRSTAELSLFSLEDDSRIGTLGPVAPQGSTIATPWAPLALDVTAEGELLVSDVLGRHRVLRLDPSGTVLTEIGGSSTASGTTGVAVALDFPNGVRAVGAEIWVTDSNNKRTLVFDEDGAFDRVVAVRGLVRGLDVVPPIEGTLETTLVALTDTLASEIALMDTAGNVMGTFGGAGAGDGQLAFPNDVCVDAERARLYVADTGNRRIQAWDIVKRRSGGPGGLLNGGPDRYRIVAVILGGLALLCAALAWMQRPRPSGTQGAAPDDRVESDIQPPSRRPATLRDEVP